MGLQFFHSVLLWGAGLVLLPVLIHLLRRRLVRVHRLPTFDFLLRTQRRIARRSRLKNWLLLLLRVSAVAVVVLLAARPLLRMEGGASGGGWSSLHLVVVLDNSASMGYRTARGTRFELAKRAAERMIRGLSASDRASVLATAGEVGRRAPRALEKEAALARLAAVEQTDAAGEPARAVQRALEGLTAPADRRSLVVLSDFARSDWERLRLRALRRLSPHTPLQFVHVAPEAGTGDVAVRGVRLRPWPPRAGAPFAAVVRVANRGSTRRERVPVSLYIGETKAGSAELDLAAGGEGTVSFRVRAPEEGGLRGRVELAPDALPATNRRFFAAAMGRRLRALIVDGDPRRGLTDSESFYIANALRATPPGGDSPILVQVVAGYEVGKVNWEGYDLIVACNVGRWTVETAETLRRFVERGGGFLLAGGGLAGRTVPGEGWLPALLGPPRAVSPPQGAVVPAGEGGHPVFAFLGAHPGRFFARVRLGRVSPLEPVRGGRVLLALPGGTPLLVVGASGAGKVAVWGSTCDRDWTDLAVRPVFVPFLRGLVDFLGGRAEGAASSIEAGRPLEVRTRAHRAGEAVQIRPPSGGEVALRLKREGEGERGFPAPVAPGPGISQPGAARARYTRTFRAGFYEVLTPGGAQTVAANVPASEGDLEPLSESALRERLPGVDLVVRALRAEEDDPAASIEGRVDLGAFFFIVLAGLLVVEGVVADRS